MNQATRTIIILLLSVWRLPVALHAQAPKVAGEAAEHLLSPVAKEAAEEATAALVKGTTIDVGKAAEEETSKSLSSKLGESANKYGEDVLILARRVPEASTALATRAPQLVPLAEQFGDDILRLEARAPGFGEIAGESYGKKDIARLLKLNDQDMKSVIVLGAHATDPTAAHLLLEGTEKGGQHFIEKISAKQVVATGLSAAMVVAAYRLSGVPYAFPDVPVKIMDALGNKLLILGTTLLSPVGYVAAAILAAWGGAAIWRRHIAANTKR